jgi:hypothetical protein
VTAPLVPEGAGGDAPAVTAPLVPETLASDAPAEAQPLAGAPLAEAQPLAGAPLAEAEPPADASAETEPPAPEAPAGGAALLAPPASSAAQPPRRPRILTEPGQPGRADLVGSSRREYPWLRGALVKFAHDDPRAAARLLIGLVPAQRALVAPPLEYDLTIGGSGTYAISVTSDRAHAAAIEEPRPRGVAAFHVAADVVTLAEVLAGVPKRTGRWFSPVKVQGRRRGAEALRDALAGADLSLVAAARAGADLDPELVFRAFAYAIHPAWTRGYRFTVAQELVDPRPVRWHVAVRDGVPVSIERRPPAQPPDAVVSMTRAAFGHLLRGEPVPSGERPAIRGDRAAVAALKAWTDRAQGA